MRVLIFGKSAEGFQGLIENLFEEVLNRKYSIYVHEYFFQENKDFFLRVGDFSTFSGYNDIPSNSDMAFSLGGDGTFLKTVSEIRDSGIPILGINAGRLGFLSNVNFDDLSSILDLIEQGNYKISERSLIGIEGIDSSKYSFALNDICVQKLGSAIISIDVVVDGDYLNTYWADGLIFSTPTGSTAYNLSVGGPIIAPESDNLLTISPIAAHNLNVRPLVLTGVEKINIRVESRDGVYILSNDNNNHEMKSGSEIIIKPANFRIGVVKFQNSDFFNTLRAKFMWGIDKRN